MEFGGHGHRALLNCCSATQMRRRIHSATNAGESKSTIPQLDIRGSTDGIFLSPQRYSRHASPVRDPPTATPPHYPPSRSVETRAVPATFRITTLVDSHDATPGAGTALDGN